MRETEFGVAHLPTFLSSVISGTRKARWEEKRQTRAATAWGSQAASLVPCLASSLISIFFGSDLAGFGMVIFRTPFDMVACTLDGSMPAGNCSTRKNMP